MPEQKIQAEKPHRCRANAKHKGSLLTAESQKTIEPLRSLLSFVCLTGQTLVPKRRPDLGYIQKDLRFPNLLYASPQTALVLTSIAGESLAKATIYRHPWDHAQFRRKYTSHWYVCKIQCTYEEDKKNTIHARDWSVFIFYALFIVLSMSTKGF